MEVTNPKHPNHFNQAIAVVSSDNCSSILSYLYGDKIEILNDQEKDYWHVKKRDGKIGYVPSKHFRRLSSFK